MIEKDNQQTDFQLSRRQKWSRCAGPLQSASFERFCLAAGLETLSEMLEQDATAACAERHERGERRQAHRWGRTKGRIGFHGGKVEIERPRVRGLDGAERVLPSWESAVSEDLLGKWAMNQMLINVSTRRFKRSVRLPEGDVPAPDGAGLSKSATSRRFVALSAARMRAWMERRLDDLDLLAIQIDGIHMDEDMLLVAAIGVDANGDKHPLVNRVDPILFGRCFESWIAALWPDRHDLIAIDGKTARRTHDRRKGLKPLHTLSAYATNARLTLAQLSVPEKTNEITAIPDLLDQLAEAKQLEGALVTIDAMGCQIEIADKIVSYKADYLLALKGNQPTLEADVESYFDAAPASELVSKSSVEKGHGRIETRVYTASSAVDWIASDRSYPGEPRFAGVKTIVKVHARVEHTDRCSFETRYFIASAPNDIERLAAGVRGHWGVESMHWLLDVEFKDDLSRYRTGHGAKNMAVVRRFALGLVRANKSKGSVKTRRKAAGWSPDFLLEILQLK
jgi:predicted transposase YbfD/YdcC